MQLMTTNQLADLVLILYSWCVFIKLLMKALIGAGEVAGTWWLPNTKPVVVRCIFSWRFGSHTLSEVSFGQVRTSFGVHFDCQK